jgi:hypothetical protein
MMKSKVLDRPLFKGDKSSMSEEEASNVGIMDGFMESMMSGEMDDKEAEGEDYETEKLLGRRPDSPEILMNNLRGDMRSVDARVDELADMVGMRAAQDTPQEVLALLQPVLAGQAAPPAMPPGGIGGLPTGMPPTGEAPMMPPAMPPTGEAPMMPPPMPMEGGAPAEMPPEAAGGIGSLPTGQEAPPPIGMARGGYVQNFRNGSDEDAVTPSSNASSYIAYPPDMVRKARQYLMDNASTKTITIPDLAEATAKRAKTYESILGSGNARELTQAQMLFDIAGGALNVAAGVDAEGRPIRGGPSSAMRLAAGLRNVPAQIGARAAELYQQKRAIKGAALDATEKEIASFRDINAKIIESNRKSFADILKSSGSSALFGKGDWEWNVVNQPELLSSWASGKTSAEQNNLIESAITSLRAPKTETRFDPIDKQPYTVSVPGVVPRFVADAEKARYALMGGKPPKEAPVVGGPRTTAPVTGEVPPADILAGGAPTAAPAGKKDQKGQKPTQAPYFYDPQIPTLYNLAGKGTGPLNLFFAKMEEMPVLNDLFEGNPELDARTGMINLSRAIGKGFVENPRFAEGERKQVERELDIDPKLLDNQQAYITRLRALDGVLLQLRKAAAKKAFFTEGLKPEDIGAARLKVQDIDEARKMIGLPPPDVPILRNIADWQKAPSGATFMVGGELRTKP